jgi:hypothetical protein
MATLEDFMRTGHLGPVILGMSPNDVMIALGDPQDTSRKSNPLQLKYGCVQLSFWKAPNQRTHELREIVITYQPEFEPLPESLAFTDWTLAEPPTERQFRAFMHEIGYLPVHLVEGSSGKQLVFLSGVTALFTDEMLHSIRLLQRENRAPTPTPLSDEREPTPEQILDMLNEADRASQTGAYRAALLIAWAGLEATLRRAALRAGRQGRIGVQPSILLGELFAAGQLTPAEHRTLEELRQLRTASAHGLAPVGLDADIISKINTISNRLLAVMN